MKRLNEEFDAWLRRLEANTSLLQPARLRERLLALDELDAAFGGLDTDRAQSLRLRLDAANTALYASLRSDIVRGSQPCALSAWLEEGSTAPSPGLGFDYKDELVSGILQLREPSAPNLQPSPEMVPYQPTPVRHILHLITAAALAEDDIFVDLGSGLGHVPLLVSIMTRARCLGIELQAAYVASARECAESLRLHRVQFIVQDVREADLSSGTVFYLYTPFSGSILSGVLSALQAESTGRPIRICTLGPCARIVAKETWLRASSQPDPGRINVFNSR